MLKTELTTGEEYMLNSGLVGRPPTIDFNGLRHWMAIGLENDRRLSLQADPNIYRLAVYNIYRLRKVGKGRASFWSDISKDSQMNRGLIIWISSFKSDWRLSIRPDPNFHKPMAYNPYRIREAGKSHACYRGDIINDCQIIWDLDRKDIGFQNGRRLSPRMDPKFYRLIIYFLCQLRKVDKGRISFWCYFFKDRWITWVLIKCL